MSAADEILDVVDEHDRVVAQLPRGQVYAENLRHRCVFVRARDAEGRIFVHRRTPTKLIFPSLHDMFVGGVVGAGETYDDAALREAEEELGVSGLPRPEFLFKFLYDGGAHGTWWSAVYEVRCELPVNPRWRRWPGTPSSPRRRSRATWATGSGSRTASRRTNGSGRRGRPTERGESADGRQVGSGT